MVNRAPPLGLARVVQGMLACALGMVLMACSTNTPAPYHDEVGRTHVIECKHWTNQCHFKAQQRCRRGYTVQSSVETEKTGGVHGRYRAYVVTVICK